MILFSFAEKSVQKMDAIKSGLKSRWVLKLEKYWIGLMRQSKNNYSDWNDSWGYSMLLKPFKFGRFHDFYEGDSLHIGWIHFEWKSEDCQKCLDQYLDRLKKRNIKSIIFVKNKKL